MRAKCYGTPLNYVDSVTRFLPSCFFTLLQALSDLETFRLFADGLTTTLFFGTQRNCLHHCAVTSQSP
jgi:hypothetical protein